MNIWQIAGLKFSAIRRAVVYIACPALQHYIDRVRITPYVIHISHSAPVLQDSIPENNKHI